MMKNGKRAAWVFGAIAIVAAFPAFAGEPATIDRHALWNIINLKCLRHLTKSEAPIPCDRVDVSAGWDRGLALLKDRVGRGRMLAIPTSFMTGIEDPSVLSPDQPNFFAAAWAARDSMNWRLRRNLPAESVAITVDSKPRRDQDVLNFAIDCLDKGVAASLAANAASIDDRWSRMSVALKGRTYWARRLDSQTLSPSPFQLLADGVEGAKNDMGAWSLAVTQVNVSGNVRLILLADRAEGSAGGRASDLQDPACAIATP
jgi:CDP-diacylglycerol pyrophosphatase